MSISLFRKLCRGAVAVLLSCLVVAPAANAAQEDVPLWIQATGSAVSRGDVDNGGSYSSQTGGVQAGWKWFTFSYARTSYDWNDVDRLSFGNRHDDPWDALTRVSLDAAFDGMFTDSLGWFGGATVGSAYEDEMDDSYFVGGRAGLSLNVNGVALRGGVGVFANGVDAKALPVVAASWGRPSDMGLSATIGFPRSDVRYRFSELWAARMGLTGDRGVYRLKNDSPVADKGYVMEEGYTLGAYADVSPIENLTFSVGPEYVFGRRLSIYDKDGDRMDREDVDGSLGGSLRMRWSF